MNFYGSIRGVNFDKMIQLAVFKNFDFFESVVEEIFLFINVVKSLRIGI